MATQSSQMQTPAPAISLRSCGRGLPQNEQPVARSVPVAFASASVIVSVAVATVS